MKIEDAKIKILELSELIKENESGKYNYLILKTIKK